jgi:hypothetical protein
MLRILKHYKFNFHYRGQLIPGSDISFSSYPGTLLSIDDFYILNSGLVVIETTIGNANADLWKFVTPETLLYWVRNLVANRLANSGPEWAKLFSLHNSGTYNNEWMVVDYNLFNPGDSTLQPGLFTVLEQLPGQTVWSDQTEVLQQKSHWPSYNLAFYPEVYNMTGTFDSFKKYGNFFSYEHSPRANIFARDHVKVTDVESMIRLMRYNNFRNETFAKCQCLPLLHSGENSISARSDLNPAEGKYPFDALGHRDHGATDMKMTSLSMMQSLEFIAISGPTWSEQDGIEPFVWSKADFGNTTKHFGLPDKAQFRPVHVTWQL